MVEVVYNPLTKTLEVTGMINPEPDHYTGDYSDILNGFTYNGQYSGKYHVDYIPDASDLWFAGNDWNVYESNPSWHHGGYYYGNSVKKREFILKCFYEEITLKEREDIRQWLHRDTSGMLMFDGMPFVYWMVRPTGIIEGQEYIDSGRYSGLFTIKFTAYNPFGYLTRKYNTSTDKDNANDYCDLIDEDEMPAAPTTSSRVFTVYNPGREACGMTIRVSGSASHPIEFLNRTNDTRCIIHSFPSNNLILDINGDTGAVKTYVSSPASASYGFAYHDRGIVRLDPGNNVINILEQNNSGGWGSTTTLQLHSINIDYSPRVL